MLGIRSGRRLVTLTSLQPFVALGETHALIAGRLGTLWQACGMHFSGSSLSARHDEGVFVHLQASLIPVFTHFHLWMDVVR